MQQNGDCDATTIVQLNIAHFRSLLSSPLDATTRTTVERLLAEAALALQNDKQPTSELGDGKVFSGSRSARPSDSVAPDPRAP